MFHNESDGERKAKDIAEWLGNAKVHKMHGRPIGIDQAITKGLKIEKLEDNQDLQEAVLSVFHATIVTFQVTDCVKMVENHNGRGVYSQIQIQAVPIPVRGASG